MAGGVMNNGTGQRKHLFVINPVSFARGTDMEDFIARVQKQFETVIGEEYAIHVSRFPRHAVRTVRQYIDRAGSETVVRVYAVGGDGILFDCLNGIVGLPNAELAPVPYGRTNDFIRSFGEGLNDFFKDIPRLASAPAIPTDILHCGSNYALNFCTVGLESSAILYARTVQQNLKAWPRIIKDSSYVYNASYYLGCIIMLFDTKIMKQKYTISIDGKNISGAYVGVNIANGPCYGGNKNAVVTAVPDDGFLDVLMLKGKSFLRGVTKMIPYSQGRYDLFPGNFSLQRGKIISIRSKDPLMIDLDGETFLDTNITVELIEGAVKIAAPNNLFYKKRREFHE